MLPPHRSTGPQRPIVPLGDALSPRPVLTGRSGSARPPVLPLWLAVLCSIGAGVLLQTAYPDQAWWIAVFPAVVLALVALDGRRLGSAFLCGLLFGLSFWLLHASWLALFLGPLPLLAAGTLMALWCAVAGVLIALAYRLVPRVWPGRIGRLLFLPAVVAGLWTAREAIESVWPYGGWGWGRLAESQSDSPFTHLFGWLGMSGLSFCIAFVCALAIEAVREHRIRWEPRAIAVVAALAVLVVAPAVPIQTDGTRRVAAVQGDGKTSYFDPPAQLGDNLASQFDATAPLFGQQLDAVVWPEGATDLDPLESAVAALDFDEVSERTGAPLIAGAITERGPRTYNTSLLWEAGRGAVDYYDKMHPVPFGEYVPDRAFWTPFAPDLLAMIGRDYTPGTRDAVFDLGDWRVGVNICFDIADDGILTDSVLGGAQAIFAQSNNADFGRSEESAQQLAIARIRAVETGRTVVNISTVGKSAIIRADGGIQDEVPWYEPRTMVADIALSDTLTPAVLFGRQLEWLVSGFGLLGLSVACIESRRGRRRSAPTTPSARPARIPTVKDARV